MVNFNLQLELELAARTFAVTRFLDSHNFYDLKITIVSFVCVLLSTSQTSLVRTSRYEFVFICSELMLLRFRSFSRKHSLLSEGALERSLSPNLREIGSRVSISLLNDFHAFSIPFSLMASDTTSSLSIQINSLRRNNNAFTSVT